MRNFYFSMRILRKDTKRQRKDSPDANSFPVELIEKISAHLPLHTLKEVMLASNKVCRAVETNALIWKKFCSLSLPLHSYKRMAKEEYVRRKTWTSGVGGILISRAVKYAPNVEITQLRAGNGLLFSSSNSTSVKVWNYDLTLLQMLEGHKGSIWTMDYSSNRLATGSTDRTIRLWDCMVGVTLQIFIGHTSTIRCLKLTDSHLISGSRDKTVRVWNVKTGKCKYVLQGHSDSVRSIDISESKGLILSGSYDGSCILWSFLRGEALRKICLHSQRVYIVRIIREMIITGGHDRVLNVSSRSGLVASYREHHGTVFDVRDGNGCFYSISCDGVLCKWSLYKARLLYKVCVGVPVVSFCLFNGLVVIGTQNRVCLYCGEDGRFIREIFRAECIYTVESSETHIFVGCKNKKATYLQMFSYDCG